MRYDNNNNNFRALYGTLYSLSYISVTSLRSLFSCFFSGLDVKLFLKRYRSGSKPLANLCPI